MLADLLKRLLASTNSFSIKAQNFHWNVEGPDFPQYHAFFSDLYSEVYGSVDPVAEYIRTLDSYAPASLTRYSELTIIEDQTKIPRAELMFEEIGQDNEVILKQIGLTESQIEALYSSGVIWSHKVNNKNK